MANNYQGDVKDFARIVPIPVIPTREQVSIGDNKVIQKLDDFTAPRLVRYIDDVNGMWMSDRQTQIQWAILISIIGVGIVFPSWMSYQTKNRSWLILPLFVIVGGFFYILSPSFLGQANKAKGRGPEQSLNVTVEDSFTVGEYDVAILSATESNALVTWLQQNEYNVSDVIMRKIFRKICHFKR